MRLPTLCFFVSLGSALPLSSLKARAKTFQFFGVNESGAQFGENSLPGVWGTHYIWPDLSTIPTFINSGFNIFRINFQMERLSPNGLTGQFNSEYLANLTETCNSITSAGAYCMIEPHNFGRYFGQIITSTSDFGSWWGRLAAEYKTNSKIVFDINNE